jgi:ATP-binding cassette, subfamily C, bacterial CydD
VSTAGARVDPAERRLLRHDPRAPVFLGAGVLFGVLASALVIAGAWLIAQVVAKVFLGGQGPHEVVIPLVGVVALAIVRAPVSWTGDTLTQQAATRTKRALRADLTAHLHDLGPAYVGRERSGELSSVLVDGMDAVDAYLGSFQPARLSAVAVPLLVLVMILVLDPPTALVLILTGPVLVLLLAMIGSRTRRLTDRRFAELRWLSAFFLDMLQGIATLKMFGRSAEQAGTIRAISHQYAETTMEVLRTAFQTSLVLEWGSAVAVAVVAVEISLRLMADSIAFDVALAVLIIVPEFFLPLRQLATRYHDGSAGRSAAERIFAILDEPNPSPRLTRPAGLAAAGSRTIPPDPNVRIQDVSFTYPDRSEPAVSHLDLTLTHGRCVALVGATGAGKSTIANLLLGFLEPTHGDITVGGIPIRDLAPGAWRRHVTWVPQRPHLFVGTVRDNIRLARPDATPAELLAAATEAGVVDFVAGLPLGFETDVGEGGVRLSGGQRQRIAIARAFLAEAPLVVLDEATSHLDPTSEGIIRDAIARLASRRTVLIVSHRLRLVSIADSIVVLAGGRVIESGAPTELTQRDGPYRRLLDAAMADSDRES